MPDPRAGRRCFGLGSSARLTGSHASQFRFGRAMTYATPLFVRGTNQTSQPYSIPPPLGLLVRVNLLQAWRRVKSVRQQSHLLSSLIGLFVLGYWYLSFLLF